MIYRNEYASEIDVFDPKIHLAYAQPEKRFTFEDLNLPRSSTATDVAATVPFPILSPEGVRAYRRALFSHTIFEKCAGSPFPRTMTLRNPAEYSPFIQEFWNHPETMQLLSEAAGVPLSIVMPTEIAHTNIQTKGDTMEEMISELSVEPDTTKLPLTEEDRAYNPLKAASIIPWHYDSYPYVCVIMLSDTDEMLGGETYIKTGDGIPQKVEGPALGHGVMLQGGQVEHLASRAMGVKERISTITSFVADVPTVYDSSWITNLRSYSDRTILYKQWTQYRLEKMKREIESLQHEIASSDDPIDVGRIQTFSQNQISYLKRTAHQLTPEINFETFYLTHTRKDILSANANFQTAELRSDFSEKTASVTPANWFKESPLWTDLAESRIDLARGRTLVSQKHGRITWEKETEYTMGDELMRQGLPEVLVLWLEEAGLWEGG